MIPSGGEFHRVLIDVLHRLWLDTRIIEHIVVSPGSPWGDLAIGLVPILRWIKGQLSARRERGRRTVVHRSSGQVSETHDVTARLVREEAEWDALRPEWQALYAASPYTSTPLDFDWLRLWWRVFGPTYGTGGLQIVTAWRGTQLVGALPLYEGRNGASPLGVRQLRFLSTGEAEVRGNVSRLSQHPLPPRRGRHLSRGNLALGRTPDLGSPRVARPSGGITAPAHPGFARSRANFPAGSLPGRRPDRGVRGVPWAGCRRTAVSRPVGSCERESERARDSTSSPPTRRPTRSMIWCVCTRRGGRRRESRGSSRPRGSPRSTATSSRHGCRVGRAVLARVSARR